jgi:hypothetical protein
MDAELTSRIYARVPVLVLDTDPTCGNSWKFDYMTKMFDMADSSYEFKSAQQLIQMGLLTTAAVSSRGNPAYVPLYEAKMIHLFDHRWATFEGNEIRDATVSEKQSREFEPSPRFWVQAQRVRDRLATKNWSHAWLIGWRDICRSTDERTVIAACYPAVAISNTIRNMFVVQRPALVAAFLGCLSSMTLDYVARQKVAGTHLTVEMLKQLPIPPPSLYTNSDLQFLSKRVLELCFTSESLAPFARDLGHEGPAFPWNEDRRAILRSELDAWYARAYGLHRDELRYILDPADVMGEDYPSETFRVLKNNEMRKYGEYRTRRLVLEAWDRLESGDLR